MQRAGRRAAGSTKGQEGGWKQQPARCSRKTQDKLAIASMAKNIYMYIYEFIYIFAESMHAFIGVVELHACADVYVKQML